MLSPGILGVLDHQARQRGDAPAVASDTQALDRDALVARVRGTRAALEARGIGPGHVVGLTVRDEVDHLVATLAVLSSGAGQIVLASHDPPTLRDAVSRRVGVTHRLQDGDPALHECAPPGAAQRVERVERVERERAAAARVFLKTSGTTGDVNLVACTLDELQAQATRHAGYAHERLLRLASIEHNNSKRHRLYAVLAGGTNVFGRFALPALVDALARLRVSCLDVSRLHAADLVAARVRLPEGVKLRTGGSAIPARLRHELRQHVTRDLHVRYAATECGAIAMAGPADHGTVDDGVESAGLPLPGVVVRVLDAAGRTIGPGLSGRIAIRAPGMAQRYVDHDAQTAERFRDGWFLPGDVGRLREDGQLVVEGRADDMLILNGLNIFPAEIERVLEAHPDVREAAAFGLVSAVHGQIPVAMVALRAGREVDADTLRRHARDALGLRAPRRVLLVAALPRNAQGKVSRRQLREAFERGLGRAVAA